MHELSIAIAIVEQAEEVARQHVGSRVRVVNVRVGAMSGVVKDALEFAWETACEGTAIQGAELMVEDVPLVMRCSQCNGEQAVISAQDLRCSVCESPAYPWELVHGQELELRSMELEEDDFATATGGSAPEHSQEK
jgi:hydrogenase nickel incorporation protein HypA/HybF